MKKFGVIGFPIKHSFSPGYFAQKCADLELDDCHYQAYEIEDLKKLKALVKKEGFCGANYFFCQILVFSGPSSYQEFCSKADFS